jgi:hypothetical protein
MGVQVGKSMGRDAGSKYLMRELRTAGSIPKDFEDFLDCMTKIDLLRKSGKQFMFLHRILLEYLAELKA